METVGDICVALLFIIGWYLIIVGVVRYMVTNKDRRNDYVVVNTFRNRNNTIDSFTLRVRARNRCEAIDLYRGVASNRGFVNGGKEFCAEWKDMIIHTQENKL